MIAFYNPVWSYYVHHYPNHPYIYYSPYSPVLYYDSYSGTGSQKVPAETALPSDYGDLLSVFLANNLGNLNNITTSRYPPYYARRFDYYQDLQ